MFIHQESADVIAALPYDEMVQTVARASDQCYYGDKAKTRTRVECEKLITARINAGHLSVIEHVSMTVQIGTNRGITHELVRHRLASFTQSSTRYQKSDNHQFHLLRPRWATMPCGEYTAETLNNIRHTGMYKGYSFTTRELHWLYAMDELNDAYRYDLSNWNNMDDSRGFMPNDTYATLVLTANMREWRHIFAMRYLGTTGRPHPQAVSVMRQLFDKVVNNYPVFFKDLVDD